MKYKKELMGSIIWAGILLFWWYCLYGSIEEKMVTAKQLYSYTCSVVGMQAPFLHGTFYLFAYLMFISQMMQECKMETILRQSRKVFFKKLIKNIMGRTVLFLSIYGMTYTICILSISSGLLLKKTKFFSSLCFYLMALCVFYFIMALLFLIFFFWTGKKTRGCLLTILTAVGFLTIRYLLHWPTPYSSLDTFDMVYFKGRIVWQAYLPKIGGNLFLIYCLKQIAEKLFCKKDVWENEI